MINVYGFTLDKQYLARFGSAELAVSAVAMSTAFIMPLPFYVMGSTALVAGGAGYYHIKKYLKHAHWKENLNSGNAFSVTPEEIVKFKRAVAKSLVTKDYSWRDRIKRKDLEKAIREELEDVLYVGSGFDFTGKHLALYETIKNDPKFESISDHTNKFGGKPFLHNLGKEDETPRLCHLKEHTLIAGESGAGKTVLLNLFNAQFILDGEAVCIIDPKGDTNLMNTAYSMAVAAGRKDDWYYFSLAHPGKSITFDPFANVLKSGDGANRITSIIDTGKSGANFQAFCWNVVNAVIENLINGDIPVTLKNIHRYSLLEMKKLFGQNLEKFFNMAEGRQREVLKESFLRLKMHIDHPAEHFSKMITSLEPVMTALATGETGALLSPEKADLTWEKIIKEKKIVYFNLASMIDSYSSSAVSKLLVQDLISYIGQMYAYEKKVSRIKLVCDEFYSVAYKGFGDALNKSRAAGLQAILGLQTDSDIAAQLDRDMVDVILGNLPNKIYMRISQEHLAEKFTNLTDDIEYAQVQEMQSTSATPADANMEYRSSASQRIQVRTQKLLTPGMVISLPMGQAFIYNKGMMPVKIAIPLLQVDHKVKFFEENLNKEFSLNPDEFWAPIDEHLKRAA